MQVVTFVQDYTVELKRGYREWTGIREYQVVTDSRQFLNALGGGAVHIELQTHMDLTAVGKVTQDTFGTFRYDKGEFSTYFSPTIQVRSICPKRCYRTSRNRTFTPVSLLTCFPPFMERQMLV